MLAKQFSRTAQAMAAHRAAHQTFENGSVFKDPLAHAILGEDADELIREFSSRERNSLRLFAAVRARFAEDCLELAVNRGISQLVILGAGLDTFGFRNPFPQLSVFEVDHPATQAWKRECVIRAGLEPTKSLKFVPVDFETQSLEAQLDASGFDRHRSAFFIWLGVVPYLSLSSIEATLEFIASIPGSEVVFDYSEPLENYPPEKRAAVAAVSIRAAAMGEPWLSHFDPREIAAVLTSKGFARLNDMGPREVAIRYLGQSDAIQQVGPHVIHATLLSD